MKPYSQKLKPLSRKLRSNQTEAEKLLWSRLRRKQIADLQFYRQKPLLGYIVDFYCAAVNLVVELDGSQHFDVEAIEYDKERTHKLESLGLRVIRFKNENVLTDLEAVLAVIRCVVESSPAPFFQSGAFDLVH